MITKSAQFLNVMNGGKLWQHVNNHSREHIAIDSNSNEIMVTSTHHQQMRAAANGLILLTANESTYKQNELGTFQEPIDLECVWYPETKSFCFQPHPEYNLKSKCCKWFHDTVMSINDKI